MGKTEHSAQNIILYCIMMSIVMLKAYRGAFGVPRVLETYQDQFEQITQ
jgi:hypothetical protein